MTAPRLTLDALRRRLDARRTDLANLGAMVNAAALLDEVLCELDALEAPAASVEPILTLTAAARLCGFSSDHLGRLVRRGDIPNQGRARAPRVRLSDCPRKAPPVANPRRSVPSSPTQRVRVLSTARSGNS